MPSVSKETLQEKRAIDRRRHFASARTVAYDPRKAPRARPRVFRLESCLRPRSSTADRLLAGPPGLEILAQRRARGHTEAHGACRQVRCGLDGRRPPQDLRGSQWLQGCVRRAPPRPQHGGYGGVASVGGRDSRSTYLRGRARSSGSKRRGCSPWRRSRQRHPPSPFSCLAQTRQTRRQQDDTLNAGAVTNEWWLGDLVPTTHPAEPFFATLNAYEKASHQNCAVQISPTPARRIETPIRRRQLDDAGGGCGSAEIQTRGRWAPAQLVLR